MTLKKSLKRYLLSIFLSGFLVSGLSFGQVDKLTVEKDLIAVLASDSPLLTSHRVQAACDLRF